MFCLQKKNAKFLTFLVVKKKRMISCYCVYELNGKKRKVKMNGIFICMNKFLHSDGLVLAPNNAIGKFVQLILGIIEFLNTCHLKVKSCCHSLKKQIRINVATYFSFTCRHFKFKI